ncbi:hypothetical protein F4821DRAFT_215546 [Hypoxylon rubiginosum]|uniref:Uncharacterized protein n=1 Tax=Hypoxylon rubiginosum TaxID=110542 RepID=A0ACC0CPT1_9PEZI|nr:hypothetical protein F4821DRAFT_215546 [Hypoxylon rubiginosum]
MDHAITEHDAAREAAASKTSARDISTNRPPLEILYSGPTDAARGQVEVDIVAVHGLGSNVDWSWIWQDKSGRRPPVHWLKDLEMLPAVVPNTRIMVYSYESRWHANAPKTRLELCGEALVRSLHHFRSQTLERPIIFVAHSLGGLVVLHGLLYADRTEEFKYLPRNTIGFAALGTPFRGSTMQSLGEKVAWLMALAGFHSHDGIIKELEPDNKHIADKVHAFSQLRNKMNLPICCFIELCDSDYGKRVVITGLARGRVVDEESAHIPGWDRVGLNADHFKLNKFSGPSDGSFIAVSNEIRKMFVDRGSVSGRRKSDTQKSHFMVPFGRNKNFVGRKSTVEQLLEQIPPSMNQDDCQRTVLEGLGGVGKTQIALETAYQVRDEYPNCSVFWVPAVDTTSFENAYRDIGRRLGVKGIDDDKRDVKTLVKAALSDEGVGSWLLIIDNADDLKLFADTTLSDYLPFNRGGSILFTTRNHEAAVKLPQNNITTITKMENDEAKALLQIGLKENQIRDAESVTCLLEFLTNLPLAIKQASTYLAKTGMPASKYLQHCQSSDKTMVKLLSQDFEDRDRYKNINNPVATTWLISFNYISRDYPLAARYLRFICYLAEEDIPISLLPPGEDELEADEAIGILKGYAFIIERNESDAFDIHRLVRLAMRNWLQANGEWQEWTKNVIQSLTDQYPFPDINNWGIWSRYLPHAQAALGLDTQFTYQEVDLTFLQKVMSSLSLSGNTGEVERMHWQILKFREPVLGKEHPIILGIMSSLGFQHYIDEEYEKAELVYRQVLKRIERMPGGKNLTMLEIMLECMNYLAEALNYQGKNGRADKIRQKMLEPCKELRGRESDQVLDIICGLASALYDRGAYEEAEHIHRQKLEVQERVLGEKYRFTLVSMDDLAKVLENQGKYAEAEHMYWQTLKLMDQVLGREDIATLTSMNNLAHNLYKQGKYEGAEEMHRQILELKERALSREHPSTLSSMDNFALVLASQGKYEEAEQIHRQTLESRERVLSREDPDTLVSMNNLVLVLSRQGKYEEAEQMYRQTLEMKERVLGREHPDILGSMNNLALVLDSQGEYEEAEQMCRQTLELMERVLGREHPSTLISMNNLALVLDSQGKYEAAEQMYCQILELRERMFGKEHPSTLKSKVNLDACSRAKTDKGLW